MNRSSRPIGLLVDLVIVLTVALTLHGRGDPAVPDLQAPGGSAQSEALTPGPAAQRVGYIISRGDTALRPAADQEGEAVAPGVIFAVTGETAGGYQVLDPCNREGWLPTDQVDVGMVPSQDPDLQLRRVRNRPGSWPS